MLEWTAACKRLYSMSPVQNSILPETMWKKGARAMTSAAKLRVALIMSLICLAFVAPTAVRGETYPPIPPSLATPNQVETSIGTLKVRDGIPDQVTADKIYDQLDLQRGVSAFLNGCAAFRSWPRATVSALPESRTMRVSCSFPA